MQLRMSTRTVEGVLVVDCSGRVVFGEESASLRDTVKKLLTESPKVVMNLREVNYIDSGGLGTLVSLYTTRPQRRRRNETGELEPARGRFASGHQAARSTIFEVFDDDRSGGSVVQGDNVNVHGGCTGRRVDDAEFDVSRRRRCVVVGELHRSRDVGTACASDIVPRQDHRILRRTAHAERGAGNDGRGRACLKHFDRVTARRYLLIARGWLGAPESERSGKCVLSVDIDIETNRGVGDGVDHSKLRTAGTTTSGKESQGC
jgi:anti-anti-sigma factor